jgi:hypothetical protein
MGGANRRAEAEKLVKGVNLLVSVLLFKMYMYNVQCAMYMYMYNVCVM